LCSRLEGGAVKVGVRIVSLELLDGPPGRSAVGDMAADTFRHAGVEDSEHTTIASEDERAGVALCGEVAGRLTIVVNGHFDRLFTKLIAKIRLQSGIASHRKVGGVAILPDDVNGIPIVVVTVGRSWELALNNTLDPEQAIGGELDPGRIDCCY
jgi:hypothetical protein